MRKSTTASFAWLLQEFFTDYLVCQRALSPQTVASYRDAFLLLLHFAEERIGKPPTALQLADLNGTFWPPSSIIWSAIAATQPARAMPDWPPCGRS